MLMVSDHIIYTLQSIHVIIKFACIDWGRLINEIRYSRVTVKHCSKYVGGSLGIITTALQIRSNVKIKAVNGDMPCQTNWNATFIYPAMPCHASWNTMPCPLQIEMPCHAKQVVHQGSSKTKKERNKFAFRFLEKKNYCFPVQSWIFFKGFLIK